MISHPHVPRSSTSAQNLISGSADFIFQGHLPSAVRIAQLLRENQLLFSQRPALPLRQTSGKSNPDLRRQGVSLESPGSSVSEDLISNFGLKSCTPYQGINRQIYGMPPNPMSEATKRFTNSVADQRPLEEELILNPPKSVPSSSYAPPPDYVHNYEI
ncbi:hypothetical protein L596_001641 [Steinernema carpocapsae]|uniref:Uncharacterized protein n=1 Tax=Steinernema carpocapsae TaxID=34508 RepID=A0A4U8ULT7_STECR|nr:hypothetical protein L596_001641 [Steinernema carpocapsae]